MANRADDKAWFGRAIESCADALYGAALRLARNAADAEDLAAETVARAWSALDSLENRESFRGWLFRILHNSFVSECRRKGVRPPELGFEDLGAEADGDDITDFLLAQPDEFLLWWGNPERALEKKIVGEDIVAALERLPEAYRASVLLVTVDGLSYDEAAQVLGVPPGTIRSRMKRGRTLLQRSLWEHARDAGLLPSGHEEDREP